MGDTLFDQLDAIERKLGELIHAVRRIRQDQEQQAKDTATETPTPRVQDNPTTNAPAHEIQPEVRPTQTGHWGDPLMDVLGFPKDGR